MGLGAAIIQWPRNRALVKFFLSINNSTDLMKQYTETLSIFDYNFLYNLIIIFTGVAEHWENLKYYYYFYNRCVDLNLPLSIKLRNLN